LLMLGLSWQSGIRVKFLGKHQLFTGPLGPLMRALGGIPVDRRDPSRVGAEIVSRLEAGERFFLVVTPEGTRSRGAHWRSGFYRIAREADLPVTLGYVDRSTMTTGLGPTFRLTGDVRADMDRIRAFYRDKTGVRPGLGARPRPREGGGAQLAPDAAVSVQARSGARKDSEPPGVPDVLRAVCAPVVGCEPVVGHVQVGQAQEVLPGDRLHRPAEPAVQACGDGVHLLVGRLQPLGAGSGVVRLDLLLLLAERL